MLCISSRCIAPGVVLVEELVQALVVAVVVSVVHVVVQLVVVELALPFVVDVRLECVVFWLMFACALCLLVV